MRARKNTNEGRIKLCKSVLCMATGLALVCCVDAEESNMNVSKSPTQRLRRDGIRAIHTAELDKKEIKTLVERSADAGFNLILPWHPVNSPLENAKKSSPPDSPIILRQEDIAKTSGAQLRFWAENCKKNDLILMYTIYSASANVVRTLTGIEPAPVAGGHIIRYCQFGDQDLHKARTRKCWPSHQYRHLVDWGGSEKTWAPCPLERRYWMGLIRPAFEFVARGLKEAGADGGAILELEGYCFYSIYPGYNSQKTRFCYCDECFYGFVRGHEKADIVDAVPPKHRKDWLSVRGLLPAYERSIEDRMAGIIREMMQDVRKIKPDFMFGFYPYAPHWFYDALIRGGGTPELPALLFSSSEYKTGYREHHNPPNNYASETSTAGGVAHLRQRGLHALYAGGLLDKRIGTPEGYAMTMDRLLRDADGYWLYHEMHKAAFEPFWKFLPAMNRWTSENRDLQPVGTLRSMLPSVLLNYAASKKAGLTLDQGHLVASYTGSDKDSRAPAQPFDDIGERKHELNGRNTLLPSLDRKVVRSGEVSVRIDFSAQDSPKLPYIDYDVKGMSGKPCELSFWVKTESEEPVHLNVGTAQDNQHPAYMWYHNYVLPAQSDWTRIRIAPVLFVGIKSLDVIRFWCETMKGKLWVDDIKVRPVQERIIDIPLELPEASDWGTVEWSLSPSDTYVEAELLAAKEDRVLQKRIYSGDSLAPLVVVNGREPLRLRLHVYPSAQEDVVLKDVKMGVVKRDK